MSILQVVLLKLFCGMWGQEREWAEKLECKIPMQFVFFSHKTVIFILEFLLFLWVPIIQQIFGNWFIQKRVVLFLWVYLENLWSKSVICCYLYVGRKAWNEWAALCFGRVWGKISPSSCPQRAGDKVTLTWGKPSHFWKSQIRSTMQDLSTIQIEMKSPSTLLSLMFKIFLLLFGIGWFLWNPTALLL